MWDGDNIAAETSGSGALKATYLRGGGELTAQQIGDSLSYYLHNAHGDVTERVDASGNVLKRYSYDAFGNITNPAAVGDPNEPIFVDQSPFGYCGEYLDKETGEIYLRARYYDPASGRFNAEDPERLQTKQVARGVEAIDHLALNQYGYCGEDPVNREDPSGKASENWWKNAKQKISTAAKKTATAVKTWVSNNKQNLIKVAIGVAAVVVGAVIIVATAGAGSGLVAVLGSAIVAGLKMAAVVGAVSAATRVAKDVVVAAVTDKAYTIEDTLQSAVDGFSSGFMIGGITFAAGAIGKAVLPQSNGIKIGSTSKSDYGRVTIGYGSRTKTGFTAFSISDPAGKRLFGIDFDVEHLWHFHIAASKRHFSRAFNISLGLLIGVL